MDGAFDPQRFFNRGGNRNGHGHLVGLAYHEHGADWCALMLPWSAALVADEESGVLASGPILTMMDSASSMAVWLRAGRFVPHATLDLRVDYLRPALSGRAVVGRAECYRLTRSIAFVHGLAHDGDAGDPVAHVAGTFMALEGYRA